MYFKDQNTSLIGKKHQNYGSWKGFLQKTSSAHGMTVDFMNSILYYTVSVQIISCDYCIINREGIMRPSNSLRNYCMSVVAGRRRATFLCDKTK